MNSLVHRLFLLLVCLLDGFLEAGFLLDVGQSLLQKEHISLHFCQQHMLSNNHGFLLEVNLNAWPSP